MAGNIKHFTDLEVWKKSHYFFLDFVKDIEEIPNTITGREIIK
ncbi:MAG: hypothetical protein V1871_08205 [Planctomycetota bacterium]